MDAVSKVLVLEDNRDRVSWLKAQPVRCDVIWKTSVNEFLQELRQTEPSEVALILLDHDLGRDDDADAVADKSAAERSTWFVDSDGHDGMDAVDALPPIFSDVPIVVWSVNNVRAPEMVKRLSGRGFASTWLPFNTSREQIATILKYSMLPVSRT